MHSKARVVVIAGPTGSGKNSILEALVEKLPHAVRLVTATTRPPRPGELHGKDYFFMDTDSFRKAREAGDIVEERYVAATEAYYGIYKPFLETALERGAIVLAQVDIIGARYLKEMYGALTLFVTVSDAAEYERRIRARHPEITDAEVAARLAIALREVISDKHWYDYCIENNRDALGKAVEDALAIIEKEGYSGRDA